MLYNSFPYGARIAPAVSDMARNLLWEKYVRKHKTEFSAREVSFLLAQLEAFELAEIIEGVNFSRVQIDEILRQRRRGGRIEFETLGPYLSDYIQYDGIVTLENLIPEDKIGLEIAIKLRKLLPSARLISLYDDIHSAHTSSEDVPFSEYPLKARTNFKQSLVQLFKDTGVLKSDATEGSEYLLIAESRKISSVERMVVKLTKLGHIEQKGEQLWFVNEMAENPLYRRFLLRSDAEHWMCVALDAASFLAEDNKKICHLVVLPEYMKRQQDKVWEILRVLSLHPLDYHNIFYPLDKSPHQVAKIIWNKFHQR